MTISTELRKAGPFTGNGVTTAFPFSFKVFAATDATVTVANTQGNESVLALGADYAVALNADQDAAPGGTVTLAAPLASGHRLVVSSAVPNLQPTDITNNGGFYPRVIEDALDRHVAQVQQIDEKVGRALKVAITSPLGDQALPSPVAGMLIGWNESSDGLKNYAPIGGTLLGQQLAAANGSSLINFQQSGTGAVVRTAQDKMREVVSVKDFGAVGDGVTDDTAAIVAGMSAGIAAGKALFFPAGTYRITSTINLDALSTAGQMVTLIGEEGAYYRTDTSGVKPTVLLGAAGLTQMFYQPFAGVMQRRLTIKNFAIRSEDPYNDLTLRAPLRAFDIYNSPYSIYENIDTIGITSLLHLRTAYFCKLSKIQTNRTREGIFIDGDDGTGSYAFADHVSLSNIVTGGNANDWGTRLRGSKSSNITMFNCETGTSGPGLLIEGCKEINVTTVYAEGFINANPIVIMGITGSALDNLDEFSMNITIDGVHGLSNTARTILLQNGVINATVRNVRELRVDAAGRETATGDWLQVSVGSLAQNSLMRFNSINLEGFFVSDNPLPSIISAVGFNQCFRINGNIIQSDTNRGFYGLTLQRGTNYNNTGLATKQLVLTNGTLSASTLTMTASTTNGSRKITVTNTTNLFPGTFITVGAQTGLFVTSINRVNNEVWLGSVITATASGVAVSYTTPTYL